MATHLKVTQQQGTALFREIPTKRPSLEFDVTAISPITRDAFKRVCVDGGATPEDYHHVFSCILSTQVLSDILGVV